MEIQYLGTAAAEAMPALFCDCENCQKAKKLGGRNIRTRSQALVNGKLLIDYPCDSYAHFLANQIDLQDIEACIITHVHEDHFYERDFYYPRPHCYSTPREDWKGFELYGSEDMKEPLAPILKDGPMVYPHYIKPYEPFSTGSFMITAMKAKHGTPHPYIYLISDGEKTMLYCHDSGPIFEENWAYMEKNHIHLDLASLDCTSGTTPHMTYESHMAFYQNKEFKEEAIRRGLADEKTVFVLNHFSHNGPNTVYDDMVPIVLMDGFLTSYDGMKVQF